MGRFVRLFFSAINTTPFCRLRTWYSRHKTCKSYSDTIIFYMNRIDLLTMDNRIKDKAKFTIVNANDLNTGEYAAPEG